jgi:hypothetical protein
MNSVAQTLIDGLEEGDLSLDKLLRIKEGLLKEAQYIDALVDKKITIRLDEAGDQYIIEQDGKTIGTGGTREEVISVLNKLKINNDYDPNFGDDKVCKCGHTYYRHFDSYEDMRSVGCKYCWCHIFAERISEERQTPHPGSKDM